MTEKEAIERLKYDLAMITFNPMTGGRTPLWLLSEDEQGLYNACEMAIKALEEIQQYRAIGTVEECREAMKKQKAKKPNTGNDNGRKRKCCPSCGCFYSPASRYCPKCGQALDGGGGRMSREILFKAKRKNWRELPKEEWWVEGDLRQDRDLGTAFIFGWDYYISESGPEREPFEYEIDPETLCQYTWLTDKNGQKIWENDIVDSYEKDAKEFLRNVVRFDCGCFKVLKEHYLPMYLDKYDRNELEVVGNIFDNPELLEQDGDARNP